MSDSDELDAMGAALAAAVLTETETSASRPSSRSSLDTSAQDSIGSTPRTSRKASKIVPAFETAEGVGARVKRSIGTPPLWNLSPFLILDYARVRPGEGFPDHPHRGMSTVSYVLEGAMEHEDFLGNRGRLGPGDVQWMTAGRGIVHSEMPYFDPNVDNPPDCVALQLWIDLPAAKKMVKPSYKDKKAGQLARAVFDGGSVVVVSGESHGAVGPIRPLAGCWFLDFRLESGGETFQEIPDGWTAFVYVISGSVGVAECTVEAHNCCVLSTTGTGVHLSNASKKPARFIVVAGEPLDQPVILQGPFVVTSKDAAVQALRDFQSGRNGFEKALGWQSEIGKAVGAAGGRKKKGKGRRGEDEEAGSKERRGEDVEEGRGKKGKGKRR